MNEQEKWLIAVRVRTSDQQAAAQLEECRCHVEQQGGMVAEIVERTGSGLTPEKYYEAVSDALRRTNARHLLVWRIDRFGRSTREGLNYYQELLSQGIRLHSMTEGDLDETDLAEKLAEGQKESKKIATRVLPAMRLKARMGRWLSSAPLGYRLIPHPDDVAARLRHPGRTLEPDPDTAPLIAELFRLAASGASEGELCRFAQASQLRSVWTKPDGALHHTNVRRILSNPAYIGVAQWGRKPSGKLLRQAEIIRVENAHPPIIERDLWERVQARYAALKMPVKRTRRGREETYYRSVGNAGRKGSERTAYMLDGGVLFCGQCGSHMRGIVTGGRPYRYYVCADRANTYRCQQPSVSAMTLEAQVQSYLEDALLRYAGDPNFLRLLTNWKEHRQQMASTAHALRGRLEGTLRSKVDARYKIIDWELKGRITSDEADRKRNEIDRDIDAINGELAHLVAGQAEAVSEPVIDLLESLARQVDEARTEVTIDGGRTLSDALERFALAMEPRQWKALARMAIRRMEIVGGYQKGGTAIIMWTPLMADILRERETISQMLRSATGAGGGPL